MYQIQLLCPPITKKKTKKFPVYLEAVLALSELQYKYSFHLFCLLAQSYLSDMEVMHLLVLTTLLPLAIILLKLVYTLYWVPLKIELHFKKQGIQGPDHHPLYGNAEDNKRMFREAEARPIPFNHDILKRVSPIYHKWSSIYGKTFLLWLGNTPGLALTDPDLIKELMLNHTDSVEKIQTSPLTKSLIGDGLISSHGKKWAVHRKITNKAFTLERVKVIIISFIFLFFFLQFPYS